MNIPKGNLRDGSSGKTVQDLQRELKTAGFDPKGVDGKFGTKTKRAVEEFQRKHKLKADGVVGAKTWAALGGDRFETAKSAKKPAKTSAKKPASSGKGTNAASQAEKYLGKYESQLEAAGVTEKGVSLSHSCANFVSAMLRKAGVKISHTDGVADLASELKSRGWHKVSLKNAKPGDVWICHTGSESHTEIVASNHNGHVTLIGSNNHPDRSNQQINYDSHSADISGSYILAP
jgi:cell wall-associated NlpC family hydrolase